MTDTLADVILVCIYVFTLVPIIGVIFGGNHCSYGRNDRYENCILRGTIVHVVVFIFYLVVTAIYYKLT